MKSDNDSGVSSYELWIVRRTSTILNEPVAPLYSTMNMSGLSPQNATALGYYVSHPSPSAIMCNIFGPRLFVDTDSEHVPDLLKCYV
jgi:hypothetical protein